MPGTLTITPSRSPKLYTFVKSFMGLGRARVLPIFSPSILEICLPSFNDFWHEVTLKAAKKYTSTIIDVSQKMMDEGVQPYKPADRKKYFKRFYIQIVDAALEYLKTRFKSEGFLIAQNIENSVLSTLNLQDQGLNVSKLLEYYGNDTNKDRLILHLKMFRDLISHDCSNSKKEIQSMQDVIDLIKCKSRQKIEKFLSLKQSKNVSAIHNGTGEAEPCRTILHYYRNSTESIDIKQLCNDFLNEMIYD
ncbi:hypothetical protein HELRODRAFT_183554 [Helobdella robusta]|uniref:Uncharacterized protein n=1 Tax=Helobdella robusta TaxID=6412 RepID=T1FJU2_HELRO|nr:hypothetical protein HELRODRAFT_183554 [Helobdella robusta]ESO10522.1 hypothetical protein HELRODRAFT_183554 [Helobdella robusta]